MNNDWKKYGRSKGKEKKAFMKAEARVKAEGFRVLMEDGGAESLRTMALVMNKDYSTRDEYKRILKPLGKEGISHLRDMLLDSRMPGYYAAAVALAWVEDPAARDALLEALESGDDQLKEHILMAMGDRADRTLLEQVARYLEYENYPVRTQAIRFVGECGAREYMDVVKRSRNVADPALQLTLAATMARLGDEEALKVLRNVAENSVHLVERGFAQAHLLALDILDKRGEL